MVELRPQNITRGVVLIALAALTISVQDVTFKRFSSNLTAYLWGMVSRYCKGLVRPFVARRICHSCWDIAGGCLSSSAPIYRCYI